MGSRGRQDRSDSASQWPVYTIEAAIDDALDRLEDTPHQVPASDAEVWIWTGKRLVRADSQLAERLRLLEILENAHLEHLHNLQRAYRQQRWQSYRRLMCKLVSPVRSLLERWRG
jgi:hypothetical protein